MKTNRGTKMKILVNATGCEPIEAWITTWENTAKEAHRGHCAQVVLGTPKALGFEQADNALEALAVQLEAAAAKIRTLKGTR